MSKDTTIKDREFAIKLGKWMHELIDRAEENGGSITKEIEDHRNGKRYTLTISEIK